MRGKSWRWKIRGALENPAENLRAGPAGNFGRMLAGKIWRAYWRAGAGGNCGWIAGALAGLCGAGLGLHGRRLRASRARLARLVAAMLAGEFAEDRGAGCALAALAVTLAETWAGDAGKAGGVDLAVLARKPWPRARPGGLAGLAVLARNFSEKIRENLKGTRRRYGAPEAGPMLVTRKRLGAVRRAFLASGGV